MPARHKHSSNCFISDKPLVESETTSAFETQPVSLIVHNSGNVYVHPITLSHPPDWWCKQREGMEHIRTERGEGQPYFYFPWTRPKWRKKVWSPFGRGTKDFPLVRSRQFWSLHGFQSPTASPGEPWVEKWRQIHGCINANILKDDCGFCHVLNFRGWFFKRAAW